MANFEDTFRSAYGFDAPGIDIGNVMKDGTPVATLPVRVPLSMMNRHGLIAGSTGTGKTRTLQVLAEGLSRNGVPVFLADVKGDLAGMARAGQANEKILARVKSAGREFKPESFPVEYFSLTGTHGIQVRATVSSFGPILLGKVLDLTDTQQSVLAMVFKYCDDRMPLLDFADLREVLNYLAGDGKEDLKQYGGMAAATVGVLVRKMVELEQQGAARFFGEPELDINDLMRTTGGRGIVNILSLSDVQDKPRLYSTFLMWLLGQFYYRMPEVGDPDKPKLVFFFDEAHLLFEDSSSALVEHIEQVARLIRSKGIGVFFITQTPKDVDDDVLAQARQSRSARRSRVHTERREGREGDRVDVSAERVLRDRQGADFTWHRRSARQRSQSEGRADACRDHADRRAVVVDDGGRRQRVSTGHRLVAADVEVCERDRSRECARNPVGEDSWSGGRSGHRSARRIERTTSSITDMLKNPIVQTAARQAARTVTQQVIRGIFGMLKGR